jgi:hypothetical protein
MKRQKKGTPQFSIVLQLIQIKQAIASISLKQNPKYHLRLNEMGDSIDG